MTNPPCTCAADRVILGRVTAERAGDSDLCATCYLPITEPPAAAANADTYRAVEQLAERAAAMSALADRYGTWRATEDDTEITVPPYWCRGADLDGPDEYLPGKAYVLAPSHNPDDEDAHLLLRSGIAARWSRVVAAPQDGGPTVEITSDDRVEIIGNDVRTIRTPARIAIGSWARLTPLQAMQLVEALEHAVQLVTDDETFDETYLAARNGRPRPVDDSPADVPQMGC